MASGGTAIYSCSTSICTPCDVSRYRAGRQSEWSQQAVPYLLERPMLGDVAGAQDAIERARKLDPYLRISNLKARVGPFRQADFTRYAIGRPAGVKLSWRAFRFERQRTDCKRLDGS